MIQLNFFETFEDQLISENNFLREEIKKVAAKSQATYISSEKVRKALFARHAEMQKRISDLEQEMEFLKKHICEQNKQGTHENIP